MNNLPEIEDYYYDDDVTFVVEFSNQTDKSGDEFNYELAYHEDERLWRGAKVYEYEVVSIDVRLLPEEILNMAKSKYEECKAEECREQSDNESKGVKVVTIKVTEGSIQEALTSLAEYLDDTGWGHQSSLSLTGDGYTADIQTV